jgi:hypothetical protein
MLGDAAQKEIWQRGRSTTIDETAALVMREFG